MDADIKRDLPWVRLALVITTIFISLLIAKAVSHDLVLKRGLLEHVRPKGAVDDLSPIEWAGELPGESYRFIVMIRDDEVGGSGELARSPLLKENSWEIPDPARSDWGRVQIRVYVVDSENMTEDFRKESQIQTRETIAWTRKVGSPGE